MSMQFWRLAAPLVVVTVVFVAPDARAQSPPNATEASALADTAAADPDADDLDNLLDLAEKDVGQLSQVNVASQPTMAPALNTEVSTVSRQKSTVGRSPTAVFVITGEMIRRSGARSVPEALRMAPGVQVARIDANKWAISIRGFNGRIANKLLVQIDGRSVYTPLFGGVFWDVQDVLLEDVERIEVIRGPGASVWGANAVNGIINVITKTAAKSQGAIVQAGAGSFQRGFANARYGGNIGEDTQYRVYGKWFERDVGVLPGAADDWRMSRGGFRVDSRLTAFDKVTFQGDYYDGAVGQLSRFADPNAPFFRVVGEDTNLSGGNALLRWVHEVDEQRDWALQMYYDHTEREYQQNGFAEYRNTFDIDFQYRFPAGDSHRVIVGAGYRHTSDQITNGPFVFEFNPRSRGIDTFSYFLQDEISLVDDELYFTIGSKFSHSDFSPFEFQPTARLLWTPTSRHSLWSSVSRAVRLPTRASQDVVVTLPPSVAPGVFSQLIGNPQFMSEDLLAWECGMRAQPNDDVSWDLALFYNRYSDLLDTQPGAVGLVPGLGPTVPLLIINSGRAESYGAELAANLQMTPFWKLYGAYTWLSVFADDNRGDSPVNQAYIQSSWDLTEDIELDLIWRYADQVRDQAVPSYNVMDARVGMQLTQNSDFAIVGRNLLDSSHPEFGDDTFTGALRTSVPRSVYAVFTLRQ